MTLTGNKDADYIVLSNLDDRSLFSYCKTDQYANKLCKDENFWRNRFVSKFGERYVELKSKDKKWKKFYLQIVSAMNLDEPDDMQEFGETEYINFYNRVFRDSLGEWDVFTFFEKYLPRRFSPFFLKPGVGKEILTKGKTPVLTDLLVRLLDMNIATFPILKGILFYSNPEIIKKAKDAIRNDEDLLIQERHYIENQDVIDYIKMAEEYFLSAINQSDRKIFN